MFEDLPQTTWVSYAIPLTAFTGLNATDHIAQLIFSGLPVGQGAVYIDNVFFSKDPVSTDDIAITKVKLFPNPAQNNLMIDSDGSVEKIEIYNTFGMLVMEQKQTNQVNIKELTSGTYFVMLTVNGKTIVEKIVKN